MAITIRQATMSDATLWIDLLKATLGEDYPDKQVYNPAWIVSQLSPESEAETWVVETNRRLQASISFLPPLPSNANPIANLGRHLIRPESYADGSAGELLRKVNDLIIQRKQHSVARILAGDHAQQVLYEKLGYTCVGFQPFKHMTRLRESSLFYVRLVRPDPVVRLPLSESLPQVRELASVVLANLKIPNPLSVRDGTIGYPLQTEAGLIETTYEEFERCFRQVQSDLPQVEVSGRFNMGSGYLRSVASAPFRAVLARRGDQVMAGLAYYLDPYDRCVRLVHSFSLDDLSMGALFRQVLKIGQDQLDAVYVEVDILVTAPRLLKTAEQLGFVPIAYLPEFALRNGQFTDTVKLVKLNMVYSQADAKFTPNALAIAGIIDRNFHDQKIGVAIISLLRELPIFDGLGDGELRKIARLFTQKLFRPGEKVFNKGDSGHEAYVVMRGAIDIFLDESTAPIATIKNGEIFGELAFLDGAARVGLAVAKRASILLVIQRTAFNDLAQQEPHLGMVVMRNVAKELSGRLRRTNAAAIAATRK
jgi:hypothetical protein